MKLVRMMPAGLLLAAGVAISLWGEKLTVESLPNPAGDGSLQPNWSPTHDGGVVLSWVEPQKDGSLSLRYAVRKGSTWSAPRTIAEHRRFFRHPAEVPEVLAMDDGRWMAHWVEMPNEANEAEYVYVSSSTDGVHWTAPLMAHHDRSAVQHGLASMVGTGNGGASLIWLETPKGEDGPAYLMRTVVDAAGKEISEERLDDDVCACCPTTIVRTAKGLLIAYRDHTPDDIRDISVIRFENGHWSQPKNIYPDKWKLNACPTNAASVAAQGDHVAIAWYTGAQEPPKVEVVFSEDGGATFSKPAIVSTGHAFGYTSVALADDGSAIVSWLERKDDASARILVRHVTPGGGAVGPAAEVASGGRMALGYPRLSYSAAGTFVAWGNSKVQTARFEK
jgi:BNR repeat-like domain